MTRPLRVILAVLVVACPAWARPLRAPEVVSKPLRDAIPTMARLAGYEMSLLGDDAWFAELLLRDTPAWSPTGARIAVSAGRGGPMRDLFVVDAASRQVTRVTTPGTAGAHPIWSPGGDALAFESLRVGGSEIQVADATSLVPRLLTRGPGWKFLVSWATEGKALLVEQSRRDGAAAPRDLWFVRTDAQDAHVVLRYDGPVLRESPRGRDWFPGRMRASGSPDGNRVAVTLEREWLNGDVLLDTSSQPERVVPWPEALRAAGAPSVVEWAPDGTALAYVFTVPRGVGQAIGELDETAAVVASPDLRSAAELAGSRRELPFRVSWSADSALLLVTGWSSRVTVLARGGECVWASPGPGEPGSPFWSLDTVECTSPVWAPVGRRLAVAVNDDPTVPAAGESLHRGINIVDLSTPDHVRVSRVTREVPSSVVELYDQRLMWWSPDGEWLAYSRWQGLSNDIIVCRADGSDRFNASELCRAAGR